MTKLSLSHASKEIECLQDCNHVTCIVQIFVWADPQMTVNTRQLFELAGAEDARKTSPFCWRIRFALRHKRLQFDSLPWRRVEKERLAATGQGKVSKSHAR